MTPGHDDASLGTAQRTADGRAALRFERVLAHPPEKVWRAITEPDQLRAWGFPAVVDLELRVGAVIRFGVTPEQKERFGLTDAASSEGRIVRVDPPHVLEYTWAAEVLRWELTALGEHRCRLVFTNILDDRDLATQAAAGWHAGLDALERHLGGHEDGYDAFSRAAELQPAYTHLGGTSYPEDQ